MKNMNLLFTVVLTLAATSCSLFQGKEEVDARHTDGNAPRAYVSQTTSTGEKQWVQINTQAPTMTASASSAAKSIADIEPAAGPGAAAVAAPAANRNGYVAGMGYVEGNR